MDYVIRRPRIADAPALFELVAVCDRADVGVVDYEPADAVEELTRPGVDLDQDAWLAEADRQAVGYASVAREGADLHGEIYAHPDTAIDLFTDLRRRLEVRAAEITRNPPAEVSIWTVDRPVPTAQRLAAAGYTRVRSFSRLVVDLPAPTRSTASNTIAVRVPTTDDEATVHAVMADAFAEHFGFAPEAFGAWRERQRNRAGYDPALWLLAEIEGQPAGALIGRHMAEHGWVQGLGVRPEFRGRGVARLLLLTTFATFVAGGYHQVALTVDTENTTGALRLYESVGMRRRFAYDCWRKAVTAPA